MMLTKKTCIDAFTRAGFSLIPLDGKKPTTSKWPDTPLSHHKPALLELKNYGVVLQKKHLVVDVDPRNFKNGESSLKKLVEAVGEPLGGTFTVKTGGGGLHLFFTKPAEMEIKGRLEQFPGIDFKTYGGQVVGPCSKHPDTGVDYKVLAGTPNALREAPLGLLNLLKVENGGKKYEEKKGTEGFKDDAQTQERYKDWLKTAPVAVAGEGGDLTTFKTVCRGRDLGLSPAKSLDILGDVWNPRCSPPWDEEELRTKVYNGYKYGANPVGASHPAADFTAVIPPPAANGNSQPLHQNSDGSTQETEISWVTDKHGQPVKCFYNLLNFFKLPTGGLYKVFGYNEFTGQVEFTNPAPWHHGRMPRIGGSGSGAAGASNSAGTASTVADHDLKMLKAYLARKHAFEQSVTTLEEAVTVTAHDNKFHPVREWLLSLKWDGTRRLDRWLPFYCNTKDTPYTRTIGKKVICAAVARILRPGCKFDHVVVLEGEQGVGKSMLCKALGGEYYGDFVIDPHNKDTVAVLQGKWIVELSEMEITRRAEANALKAFVSRETDKVRLAYGRMTSEFPRQCVFIGTTNQDDYLKDETGNRRFWPVRVGKVDFLGIKKLRGQLFAEAIEMLKKGETLHLTDEAVQEEAKIEASERHMEHPWKERIAAWLEEPEVDAFGKVVAERKMFVPSRDIYVMALGGTDLKFGRHEGGVIAGIMRGLGWHRSNGAMKGRGAVRGYRRNEGKVEENRNGLEGLI